MVKQWRRKLGLERCKRCGWRKIDFWLGLAGYDGAGPCFWARSGICTYETWEGLE